MNHIERKLGAQVQEAREARGWSQGRLAREMNALGYSNFHQTTISRTERGVRPILLSEASALTSILCIDLTSPSSNVDTIAAYQAGYDAALLEMSVQIEALSKFNQQIKEQS
jgi:ribosome-binding protein aMBF1 (putative translation factor)